MTLLLSHPPLLHCQGLASKIAVRAYLCTMKFEGMWALRCRRWLIGLATRSAADRKMHGLNVFPDVYIEGFSGLILGDHVSINRASNISCFGGVTLGDNVSIGHGTSIISTNHGFSDPLVPIKFQPVTATSVVIGSNVWIGAKVTILPGVRIPDGTVIAAGAVVTRSIKQPNMIIAGVPARVIKSRFA